MVQTIDKMKSNIGKVLSHVLVICSHITPDSHQHFKIIGTPKLHGGWKKSPRKHMALWYLIIFPEPDPFRNTGFVDIGAAKDHNTVIKGERSW